MNYESVQPYPLEEIHVDGWNADSAGAYRAEKISYAAQRPNLDTSRIIYNAGVTLSGIPDLPKLISDNYFCRLTTTRIAGFA